MICPKCNSEIKDGSKFCTNCGEPLPKTKKCIQCDTYIKEEALFCTNCGAKQPVKEDKSKVDDASKKKVEQPQQKILETKPEPKQTEIPKIDEKKTIAEKKTTLPKVEPKQKQSENSVSKKKRNWIPIFVTALLIGVGYFVKQGKSESKEENIEFTTSTESNSNDNGFMSERDIRSFLCNHIFIDNKGNKIIFIDNANVLVYNGNKITTSLSVQNDGIDELNVQGANLQFQGVDDPYSFYWAIGDGKSSIMDMKNYITYEAYTFEETSRRAMENVEAANGITWVDFYNDYVFGNKDFSNIAHTICTPKLLQFLKDAYDQEYECLDGECYAMWLFRTGNQDGVSNVSKVTNITNESDGWVKVSYIDMGIEGATYIKFISYNGQDYMDEIQRVY